MRKMMTVLDILIKIDDIKALNYKLSAVSKCSDLDEKESKIIEDACSVIDDYINELLKKEVKE